jgi:DNA polymerase-3 subunit epsilon/oligoribonuclease
MFWAITIANTKKNKAPFPRDLQFSKDAIASHYHLPAEEKPHRAMNGVNHLFICYQAVVGFSS